MAPGDPLRIAITCYPSVGGSGILATALGEDLAGRGHEVHFICYERPFRLPAALSQPPPYQFQLTPASESRSLMFIGVVVSSMGGILAANPAVGWYQGSSVFTP